MSTKTTFKRISLVAVAALSMGVLTSVAPASAAVPSIAGGVTHSLSTATSYVAVGTPAITTYTIGGTSKATGAGSVVVTETFPLDAAGTAQGATAAAGSALTAATSAAQATAGGDLTPTTTAATGAFSVSHVMTVTPDKPGVYTVTFTPDVSLMSSGVVTANSAQVAAITWTVYAGYSLNSTYANTAFPTVGVNTTTGWSTTTGGRGTVRITNLPSASNTFYVTATGGTIQSYAEVGSDSTLGSFVNTNTANLNDGFNFTSTTPTSAAAVDVTILSTTGDVTVKVAYFSASGALTTFTSAVMTVGDAAALSVTNSTAILGTGSSNATVAGVDDVVFADGTVGAQRANVTITLLDQYKNPSNSKTLSAVVSGPALVAFSAGAQATQGTASAASLTLTSAQNTAYLGINGTGVGGVATIIISAGTSVIATKSVTFYGTATQLKNNHFDTDGVTNIDSVYIPKSGQGTLHVGSYDVAGKKVSANPSGLVVTSDSTTVATVAISGGQGDILVTGVSAGKANITVSVGALATATIKLVIPVEITKTTAKTVTMSFDKATYAPGEKMTLTVNALDSNGSGVADGARVLFSDTATANVALGTLPTGTVTLAGGIKTYTYYAPFAAGTINVSAYEGAAVDAVIASAAYTAAKITASATVVNADATAATDAANEATDAANAATDAALAAADAADAATQAAQDASDAVATLSATVTKLVAVLKAQITTLTNLVLKIQKKVGAK